MESNFIHVGPGYQTQHNAGSRDVSSADFQFGPYTGVVWFEVVVCVVLVYVCLYSCMYVYVYCMYLSMYHYACACLMYVHKGFAGEEFGEQRQFNHTGLESCAGPKHFLNVM